MDNIPINSAVKRLLQNFCSRIENREFYLYDEEQEEEQKVATEYDE